jgi:hypothetical protein
MIEPMGGIRIIKYDKLVFSFLFNTFELYRSNNDLPTNSKIKRNVMMYIESIITSD